MSAGDPFSQPSVPTEGESDAAVSPTSVVQRRTVRTLVVTQAFGGVGLSSALTMAPVLARDVSGSDALAGLAQTAQVLGAALIVTVLATAMARRGRRTPLTLGYLTGAVGAVLCIVAGVVRSFPLLLVGTVLLGAPTAANTQSRYAATDLASPAHRGRALSTVVWATTLGAVVGPNLAGPGGLVAELLHLPVRTGPFVFSALALLCSAAVMTTRLRPDPLLVSRAQHLDHAAPSAVPPGGLWTLLRTRPLVLAAAVGMALTHAVMISVMVMTPIHMDHGSASLELIGLVVSVHILGMYAFSPLVGMAVDRLGSPPVMGAGGIVLLVALVLAGGSPEGSSVRLGGGLFLLGLGWSFGMVAASTLLTAATPWRQRPQMQGLVDMATGFTAAAGGAASGVVLASFGFGWLNAGAAALAAGLVVVAAAASRHTAGAEGTDELLA